MGNSRDPSGNARVSIGNNIYYSRYEIRIFRALKISFGMKNRWFHKILTPGLDYVNNFFHLDAFGRNLRLPLKYCVAIF